MISLVCEISAETRLLGKKKGFPVTRIFPPTHTDSVLFVFLCLLPFTWCCWTTVQLYSGHGQEISVLQGWVCWKWWMLWIVKDRKLDFGWHKSACIGQRTKGKQFQGCNAFYNAWMCVCLDINKCISTIPSKSLSSTHWMHFFVITSCSLVTQT